MNLTDLVLGMVLADGRVIIKAESAGKAIGTHVITLSLTSGEPIEIEFFQISPRVARPTGKNKAMILNIVETELTRRGLR